MAKTEYCFDWADFAYAGKVVLDDLKAVFIAAPRSLSGARFRQLIKTYLPTGNIVLGIAKEPYVLGFEGQPQFKTLSQGAVQKIIDIVNASSPTNKIFTLTYAQRDLKYLLEKLNFRRVVLVRGSWQYTFHTQPAYYILAQKHLNYDMVSPFVDEIEARNYEASTMPSTVQPKGAFTATDMMLMAGEIAKRSFDYSFQTGITLGRKSGSKYDFLAQAFNKVVPYQSYAMHHGASREINFSPPSDLNYYDAVHAEVELMITAQQQNLDLRGSTVFINLLPCPMCARMFADTDIAELVYANDHSEGYGQRMLLSAGKKVRRLGE